MGEGPDFREAGRGWELLKDAGARMWHLLSSGQVRFNCSIRESMKLSYEDWMTADDVFAKLDSIGDKNLWGGVYAR